MKFLLAFCLIVLSCAHRNQAETSDGDIQKTIKRGDIVHIENKTFEDAIDFTRIVDAVRLSDSRQSVTIESPIYFKNCRFKKGVTAYRAEQGTIFSRFTRPVVFLGCVVEGDFMMRSATFDDVLILDGTTFEGKASLESSVFRSEASLKNTTFRKEARFQNAYFQDHLSFRDGYAAELISFQSCRFLRDFTGINARFFGYVDFSLLRCDGFFNFNYAAFEDRCYISNAQFRDRAEFVGVKVNDLTVKNSTFWGVVDYSKLSLGEKTDHRDVTYKDEVKNAPF